MDATSATTQVTLTSGDAAIRANFALGAPTTEKRPGRWCVTTGQYYPLPLIALVAVLPLLAARIRRRAVRFYAMRRAAVIPAFVIAFGLSGMNCAFFAQIIDRTISDTPEMKADRILFDRDLPDITSSIAGGGEGTGGGAVGGCWNCGCRRPGLPVYNPESTCCVKPGVESMQAICCEPGAPCASCCAKKSCCEPSTAGLFPYAAVGLTPFNSPTAQNLTSLSETGVASNNDDLWTPDDANDDLWTPDEDNDDLWTPDDDTNEVPFVDKGEKAEQEPDKSQFELALETRASHAIRKPAELDDSFEGTVYPELGRFPNNLYYFAFYAGITSQMSWMAEAEHSVYDESNSGWGKLNFTKLLDSDWRMDFEVAGIWSSVGEGSGYRTAFTYGGPLGLNTITSFRLQGSQVGGNWGGQFETEFRPLLTETLNSWVKGYYYWDENEARKLQLGLGLSQHLGYGTAAHLSINFADAQGEIDVDYDIDPAAQPKQEAQSLSAKIEIRHRLGYDATLYSSRWLLRCAYQRYNDSWGQQADIGYVMADYMFKAGTASVGYRHYASNAGYEAGSFVVSGYFMW